MTDNGVKIDSNEFDEGDFDSGGSKLVRDLRCTVTGTSSVTSIPEVPSVCFVLSGSVGASSCDDKLGFDGFLDSVMFLFPRAWSLYLSISEIDDGDDGKRGVFALLKVR